ncbi:Phospholipase [Mucor velutinosus]|uniref:Phospholipase n=1 Tax=Mucor velutinosus TaxID=708070 RepID=A0AAN7I2E2_9FUNG|nr:Phospholipase [Mucor velutinosus]
MQFMRNNQKNAAMAVRFMSSAATKPKKQPKLPRYSPQNQQILDDMMIPGPALRFFKTKKERRRPNGDSLTTSTSIEQLYTTPARLVNYNEFDSAPNIPQQRLAERLQRAISTMYSTEVMPSQWVTPGHVTIRGVKVSRNLRKCRVLYEPSSTVKKERGNVHRALQDYTPLLSSMIRNHAQLKRPLSLKFVSDSQAKEMEDVFEKLMAMEKEKQKEEEDTLLK